MKRKSPFEIVLDVENHDQCTMLNHVQCTMPAVGQCYLAGVIL